MTPEQLKKLQDKRNALSKKMKDLLKEHEKGLSAEASEKFDKMNDDFEALTRQINAGQKALDNEKTLNAALDTVLVAGSEGQTPAQTDKAKAYKDAFFDMVRNGYNGSSEESKKLLKEFKAEQIEGTGSKGGYLVPTLIANEIITGQNASAWIRGLANVYATESTTKIPVDASIPAFGWIEEKGTYSQAQLDFTQVEIAAHKVGGIIKVSDELLSDSVFDLESHLVGKSIVGFNAAEEKEFLTGDGNNKPTGITVSAGSTTTTANASGFTIDEIVDFVYSLKSGYRENAVIVGSTDFVKAARKLKDGNGNLIWEPNLKLGEPEKLLNKPLRESEYLPGIASGNIVATVADLRYYDVADRGGITLLRMNEKYAEEGMVGFRMSKRVDGKLTIADAAGNLKMG